MCVWKRKINVLRELLGQEIECENHICSAHLADELVEAVEENRSNLLALRNRKIKSFVKFSLVESSGKVDDRSPLSHMGH